LSLEIFLFRCLLAVFQKIHVADQSPHRGPPVEKVVVSAFAGYGFLLEGPIKQIKIDRLSVSDLQSKTCSSGKIEIFYK